MTINFHRIALAVCFAAAALGLGVLILWLATTHRGLFLALCFVVLAISCYSLAILTGWGKPK